jgi:hypothetical protein
MADNTQLSPGAGGDVIGSDDIGGVKYQRVKLIHGADGVNAGDVASGNPLPVTLGLTDAQLRASAVPVSIASMPTTPVTGTFWQATQPVSFTWAGLTDAQLRASSVPALVTTNASSQWPNYSSPSDTAERNLSVDDFGSLQTRGAVLTDEGTFRVNFSNTSVFLSLGAVTVSGNVVTGVGFNALDMHVNDYFKIAADADTFCRQIDSIDNDTQITLKSVYTGSASGTGNRSLVAPFAGSGGSYAVASGALTLTGGTTATTITGIKRYTDYGPLVFRSRVAVSQRIVNQEIHIGLEEDAAVTRWFARFLLDGTVNTTVKCETGRNPSGAPSAAETQTSTVTLPNGATTATARDYRVELLTESVRFFIDNVLVAEHVNVIPHQHDEMTSHVEIRNGTSPASSTTVTVDYLTGKNHNKLEVGVMSDAEKIIASAAPLVPFTYSVAGVITINTDLIVLDCSQLRSLFIQCNSMGTTGVVTVQWANDAAFTAPITATLLSEAGATSTTFNAAVLRVTNVMARYCRLRLTTATTAGTTTINVWGSQDPYIPIISTQPVSLATNTPTLAAGTNRAGFIAGAGIWYDDSAVVLAANATFTGTSRDATVTATATAFANAATYAMEVRVSAESDQSGTLWLEVSRDNTNWRRAKSVATAAVTGGGQYAEIVHRPSWRYWRAGFTNGATLQTRFSIGSIAIAA